MAGLQSREVTEPAGPGWWKARPAAHISNPPRREAGAGPPGHLLLTSRVSPDPVTPPARLPATSRWPRRCHVVVWGVRPQ